MRIALLLGCRRILRHRAEVFLRDLLGGAVGVFGVYLVGGFFLHLFYELLHHHALGAGVGFVFDQIAGEDLAVFVVLRGGLFFLDAEGLNGFAGLAAVSDAGLAHALGLVLWG